MQESLLKNSIKWFIVYLPFIMAGVFVVAAFFRWVIYYTVRRHEWFAREFEKRVHRHMEQENNKEPATGDVSFYVLSKKLLEKTYYEVFSIRDRQHLDSIDNIITVNDRVFLVKQGCAWLVKDILKQLKHLKWSKETPKLMHITKATIHHNPCFNKVFGIFPMSGLNDLLSILPGLFVVAGILGTFLGIKGGLVELGSMDMQDLEGTKTIMNNFLQEIAFAMSSSIMGIIFSLALHIINTSWSPERVYVSLIDRFENAMDLIWYRSDNNIVPAKIGKFDENRDPIEALAEESINVEIMKGRKQISQTG